MSKQQGKLDSEATLHAILDACVDAIITMDSSGTILSFNRAAERIFGYCQKEAVGKKVNMLMPEPDRSQHDQYLERYLATGEARIIGIGREVTGRRKNGSTFPVSLAVSEVVLSGRRMFTGILRDMTDYNRMRARLIQSETLAAIGEMAASVAHEIKNPLAGIRGALEIFRDDLEPKDPRREVMGDVLGEVNRLDRVVRDLLDFARPWDAELQWCDFVEITRRTARTFIQDEAAGGLEIDLEGPPKLTAQVDPWLVEKVLWNLFKNAWDADSEKNRIEVSVGIREGFLDCRVRDFGKGITEEEMQLVFRPFFTSKNRGTGLGLSICRKIMAAHNGDIWLDSEEGKGTTAVLRFPFYSSVDRDRA